MLCECGHFDYDHHHLNECKEEGCKCTCFRPVDDDNLWFDPPSRQNGHDLTTIDTANANVRCLRCAKAFIKQSEWMETPCKPQEITAV
jgi:hypothetical protein